MVTVTPLSPSILQALKASPARPLEGLNLGPPRRPPAQQLGPLRSTRDPPLVPPQPLPGTRGLVGFCVKAGDFAGAFGGGKEVRVG